MIGILAYGSLIANPGAEIKDATESVIDELNTPFEVEYARKSKSRSYAPTLVPVGLWQGGRVKAQLFVLKPVYNEHQAVNMLYRRERDKVGQNNVTYSPPSIFNTETVIVDSLFDFAGIERVFYTRIGANLTEILDSDISLERKARLLAYLAIESIDTNSFNRQRDGVQYLHDNIEAGIITLLTEPYRQALLQMAANAPDLPTARLFFARQKGIIS